jgi:hypothetical protein
MKRGREGGRIGGKNEGIDKGRKEEPMREENMKRRKGGGERGKEGMDAAREEGKKG